MSQFARAVSSEVSLTSFGVLEDLLLKENLVGGKIGNVEKVSEKSSFTGCAGTLGSESVASCSVYSILQIVSRWEVGKWLTLGHRNRVRAVKLMMLCRLPYCMWSEWD